MEETAHLRSRANDRRIAHPETLLVTFLLDELDRARQRIATLEALVDDREPARTVASRPAA